MEYFGGVIVVFQVLIFCELLYGVCSDSKWVTLIVLDRMEHCSTGRQESLNRVDWLDVVQAQADGKKRPAVYAVALDLPDR